MSRRDGVFFCSYFDEEEPKKIIIYESFRYIVEKVTKEKKRKEKKRFLLSLKSLYSTSTIYSSVRFRSNEACYLFVCVSLFLFFAFFRIFDQFSLNTHAFLFSLFFFLFPVLYFRGKNRTSQLV